MSSRDMAGAKGISFGAVNNFRRSIRKKLALVNKKITIRAYLANDFTA